MTTIGEANDIARLAALTGCYDAAPVVHEPFRQWVVEDDFVGGERPDLAAVGVRLVADVTPYEDMKLRLLNATHSALAYLGFLAGHETIADTVAAVILEPITAGGGIIPFGCASPAAIAPAFSLLKESKESETVEKMCPQPPICWGM